VVVALALVVPPCGTARTREPNSSYAARRAKLRAQLDGPVVLFGFTGREDASPSYVFAQEDYFYYLTGHNETAAALLLIPDAPPSANGKTAKTWDAPREILFLQPRNRMTERWNGPRIGPDDPDVREKTGFEAVKPFSELRAELERASKLYPAIYTLLPGQSDAGYPHARNWMNWLYQSLPQANFKDVRRAIGALRQVKSASELELLGRAIELSIDAHIEAMKMMRPGIYEYEVAAQMEYVHKRGGCEREGYAPIVGSGPFSTALHYNKLDRKIEDGDLVVLDVAGEYAGYSADLTRTLPANGRFTPRQREIYEIVLGAQNAVLAAMKPGMRMGGNDDKSLEKIARDYMNAHGKDKQGNPLGRYFIHGLGHNIGLNVHDPGDADRLLEPGMVVTLEPGIYIPEENLGVRIEDDILITETGCKVLSARLPRTPDEIEKIMAEAKRSRPDEE
jgi:Xaa-Pro aminopeptidase